MKWKAPSYRSFLADGALDDMEVLFSFNVDQRLADTTVDHRDAPLWRWRVRGRQLIRMNGRDGDFFARRICQYSETILISSVPPLGHKHVTFKSAKIKNDRGVPHI